MAELCGVMPALVTPVSADGTFLPAPFEKLLERVYTAGVHGVYVCGQTGEGLSLSLATRKRAAETAVRCSPPGKQVIVHAGAASTRDAIELVQHAASNGAHAVSSLPPIGAYSFEEIRAYYQTLAAASDVPVLVYYFPGIAPAVRSAEQLLDLCRIPNVVGLKFTDSDFFRMWTIRRSGAIVFNGFDEMMLAGLIMGANGGIGSTYNLIPESFVELYRLATSRRWEEARAVQDRITEFVAVLLNFPLNSAIKLVLQWTGIDCGLCVPPRRPLTPAEQVSLRAQLTQTVLGKALLESRVPAGVPA